MTTQTPLKLLFLHGYTQSGTLFHAKTKALEKLVLKTLPKGSALFYPTAPHKLRLCDLPGWTPAPAGGKAEDETDDNWAWCRRIEATGEYIGLEGSWKFLSDYLDEHGPFDGCVGFSLGAAFAVMLAALLEPDRPPALKPASFTAQHPPLKFCVSYSGFKLQGPQVTYFYEPRVKTPVLHFIGSLDTVVSEDNSLQLVEACEGGDKLVVYHPGGHYLPSGKQFGNVMLRFVIDVMKGREQEEEESVEDMDFLKERL